MRRIAEAALRGVETDLPIDPLQKEPGIVSGRCRTPDIDVDRAGMRETNRPANRLERTRRHPAVVTERVIGLCDPPPVVAGCRHAANHATVRHDLETLERSRIDGFNTNSHRSGTFAAEHRSRLLSVR